MSRATGVEHGRQIGAWSYTYTVCIHIHTNITVVDHCFRTESSCILLMYPILKVKKETIFSEEIPTLRCGVFFANDWNVEPSSDPATLNKRYMSCFDKGVGIGIANRIATEHWIVWIISWPKLHKEMIIPPPNHNKVIFFFALEVEGQITSSFTEHNISTKLRTKNFSGPCWRATTVEWDAWEFNGRA